MSVEASTLTGEATLSRFLMFSEKIDKNYLLIYGVYMLKKKERCRANGES